MSQQNDNQNNGAARDSLYDHEDRNGTNARTAPDTSLSSVPRYTPPSFSSIDALRASVARPPQSSHRTTQSSETHDDHINSYLNYHRSAYVLVSGPSEYDNDDESQCAPRQLAKINHCTLEAKQTDATKHDSTCHICGKYPPECQCRAPPPPYTPRPSYAPR